MRMPAKMDEEGMTSEHMMYDEYLFVCCLDSEICSDCAGLSLAMDVRGHGHGTLLKI
jgi:hypothetical protein